MDTVGLTFTEKYDTKNEQPEDIKWVSLLFNI